MQNGLKQAAPKPEELTGSTHKSSRDEEVRLLAMAVKSKG